MSITSFFARLAGTSSYWFLHRFRSGGSSFPGKLATRLDPDILRHLAQDYHVIIVTGTNGKTMTTSLLAKIMSHHYGAVLTNPTGSNMIQGIVAAFLAYRVPKGHPKYAVLEVDEANVEKICRFLTPEMFVLTNIFRDQMDRYGEIYTTYDKILAGIKLAPKARLIVNGDASIFQSVALPNPTTYYGFDHQQAEDLRASFNSDGILCPRCQHILHYHAISYANLGAYFCPNCGFKRPPLTDKVTAIEAQTPTQSRFTINGDSFTIHVGGTYNIYNALAAYSTARALSLPLSAIHAAFAYDEQVFGRQEVIHYLGKELTIILVKNPVGLNQVIDLLNHDTTPYSLGFLLNARPADGRDTSWIWDGEFEHLPFDTIPEIIAGGERYQDGSLRFQVAGAHATQLQSAPELEAFVNAMGHITPDKGYILTTYTAMLALRRYLAEQHIIKMDY